MGKPTGNHIHIGKDEWIPWEDFGDPYEYARDIDEFVLPLDDFWTHLETNCVATSCGIDAFNFWPEHIQQALTKIEDPQILKKLCVFRDELERGVDLTFVSGRLNNYFPRDVFLRLLNHIILSVSAARRPDQG